MADVIRLADGSIHTVFDLRGMMELIDTHLGFETRRWLEDYLADADDPEEYITDLEAEIKSQKEHHHAVMGTLRDEAAKIASLIREKDIDRKALSSAAGTIGSITWREMNV